MGRAVRAGRRRAPRIKGHFHFHPGERGAGGRGVKNTASTWTACVRMDVPEHILRLYVRVAASLLVGAPGILAMERFGSANHAMGCENHMHSPFMQSAALASVPPFRLGGFVMCP